MNQGLNSIWKRWLTQGLEDDQWQWDWTALGAISSAAGEASSTARIVAKSDGIWAGGGLFAVTEELSREHGMPITVRSEWTDGQPFSRGQILAHWVGDSRAILAFERPVLNLASAVSGIATQTRRFVDLVARAAHARSCSAPRVAATRKTLPGYRDLAIQGVRVGGGFSHRVSLSGGVLIKENHITIAGGIERAILGARAQAPHGLQIEVEVTSLAEAQTAAGVGVHGLLLDNFLPDQVTEAVQWLKSHAPQVWIEVSGGIRESNIADYVIPGVSVISSGALTHSVVGPDLSLLVD